MYVCMALVYFVIFLFLRFSKCQFPYKCLPVEKKYECPNLLKQISVIELVRMISVPPIV